MLCYTRITRAKKNKKKVERGDSLHKSKDNIKQKRREL